MRLALVIGLILAAGCESNGDKLAQLRSERLTQCLLAESYERNGDTTYQDAPIRCRIADKKLEEFLAKH